MNLNGEILFHYFNNMKHHQIILFIPLILIILLADSVYAYPEEKTNFNESLRITKSELNFSQNESWHFITCIGEIENLSAVTWDNIVIEVLYYNSSGKIIDTVTEHLYSSVLPANDKVSFRIRSQADKNKEEYVNHSARITSAEEKTVCGAEESSSLLETLAVSWGPFLLLAIIWIIFIYRVYGRKASPQAKSIQLVSKQVELIERQNLLFQKLIETIEKK